MIKQQDKNAIYEINNFGFPLKMYECYLLTKNVWKINKKMRGDSIMK